MLYWLELRSMLGFRDNVRAYGVRLVQFMGNLMLRWRLLNKSVIWDNELGWVEILLIM